MMGSTLQAAVQGAAVKPPCVGTQVRHATAGWKVPGPMRALLPLALLLAVLLGQQSHSAFAQLVPVDPATVSAEQQQPAAQIQQQRTATLLPSSTSQPPDDAATLLAALNTLSGKPASSGPAPPTPTQTLAPSAAPVAAAAIPASSAAVAATDATSLHATAVQPAAPGVTDPPPPGSDVPPALQEAYEMAVARGEVNPVDADEAARTLAQSLAPWVGVETILVPRDSAARVPVWTEDSIQQDVAASLTMAQAAAQQPIPPAAATNAAGNSSSACCELLASIGFQSNVPVLVVDTRGQVVPVRDKVPALICTCGVPGGQDGSYWADVRVRGSSSAVQMVKKQFALTLREGPSGGDLNTTLPHRPPSGTASSEQLPIVQAAEGAAGLQNGPVLSVDLGKKRQAPFVGLPEADEWVLWGDDLDLTLGMRNTLGYAAARAMGAAEHGSLSLGRAEPRWAPRTAAAELFLLQDGQPLGPSHYWGAYWVYEKIERDKNRIKIKKLDENKATDLSGGYIFGYERSLWPTDIRLGPGLVGTTGDGRNVTYVLHDPGLSDANSSMVTGNGTRVVAWASSYLATVEAAVVNGTVPTLLAATDPAAPVTGGWRALIDEAAFIDYLLVLEISKNPDSFRGSVYMSKDRGGPLVMGPVWDLNEAWGACCGYPIEGYQDRGVSNGSSGGSAISAEGWRFNICDEPERCIADPLDGISLWYRATWAREPEFRAAVAARWRALRRGAPVQGSSASAVAAGSVPPLGDAWWRARLSDMQTQLAFSAPRNFIRWASVLSSPYFPTPFARYAYSVRAFTKWLWNRLAWLDSAFEQVAAEAATTLAAGPDARNLVGAAAVASGPLPVDAARGILRAAAQEADAAAARAQQLGGLVGMGSSYEAWQGPPQAAGGADSHSRAAMGPTMPAPAASAPSTQQTPQKQLGWGWQAMQQQQQMG